MVMSFDKTLIYICRSPPRAPLHKDFCNSIWSVDSDFWTICTCNNDFDWPLSFCNWSQPNWAANHYVLPSIILFFPQNYGRDAVFLLVGCTDSQEQPWLFLGPSRRWNKRTTLQPNAESPHGASRSDRTPTRPQSKSSSCPYHTEIFSTV